jgi:hypothetical protein
MVHLGDPIDFIRRENSSGRKNSSQITPGRSDPGWGGHHSGAPRAMAGQCGGVVLVGRGLMNAAPPPLLQRSLGDVRGRSAGSHGPIWVCRASSWSVVGVEALSLIFFSTAMTADIGDAGFGLIKSAVWP